MTRIIQPRYTQIFAHDAGQAELAKLIWREVVDALTDRNSASVENLKRADRYSRAWVEYETLYPIAAAEGPVKVGPNGGDVFNFNWSACEKLNDRLLKLEKAMFGEAVARETGARGKPSSAPSDEFLGPDNGIRQ